MNKSSVYIHLSKMYGYTKLICVICETNYLENARVAQAMLRVEFKPPIVNT